MSVSLPSMAMTHGTQDGVATLGDPTLIDRSKQVAAIPLTQASIQNRACAYSFCD
jgi:hypothetical protein